MTWIRVEIERGISAQDYSEIMIAISRIRGVRGAVSDAGARPASRPPEVNDEGSRIRIVHHDQVLTTCGEQGRHVYEVLRRQTSHVRGSRDLLAMLQAERPDIWEHVTPESLRSTVNRLDASLEPHGVRLKRGRGIYEFRLTKGGVV